jgi:AcrR family transcriptional regulator
MAVRPAGSGACGGGKFGLRLTPAHSPVYAISNTMTEFGNKVRIRKRANETRKKLKSKSQTKPTGAYRLHRERQRRRILDAAGRLFDERGIDRATAAEIASASGVRASTLYEYFANKDDIVWAILREMLEEGAEQAKTSVEGAKNGLARIAALLEHLADVLAKHPEKVRFMAQFDAMYARDWPAERLLTLERQIYDRSLNILRTMIRDGIADGSLRSDLDPDVTLHAVINAVLAAQRRLASLGTKVELEYGQPIDRLFRETIRILVFGLRAAEPSPGAKTDLPAKARKSTTRKRSL